MMTRSSEELMDPIRVINKIHRQFIALCDYRIATTRSPVVAFATVGVVSAAGYWCGNMKRTLYVDCSP